MMPSGLLPGSPICYGSEVLLPRVEIEVRVQHSRPFGGAARRQSYETLASPQLHSLPAEESKRR